MYLNIHVFNLAQENPGVRRALADADLVYCDGEGIRLGARLLGEPALTRMTAADFIEDVAAFLATERLRLFWVGGRQGVAERAVQALAARYPGLDIAGTHHGYFAKDREESDRVVAAINAATPNVVIVGLGSPTQELWLRRVRQRIDAPVVWALGATADNLAGVQWRAPRWMAQNKLEWLWRLAANPRRMFARYVIGNPLFIARVLRARLGNALSERERKSKDKDGRT